MADDRQQLELPLIPAKPAPRRDGVHRFDPRTHRVVITPGAEPGAKGQDLGRGISEVTDAGITGVNQSFRLIEDDDG